MSEKGFRIIANKHGVEVEKIHRLENNFISFNIRKGSTIGNVERVKFSTDDIECTYFEDCAFIPSFCTPKEIIILYIEWLKEVN